jgi:energy-converting hydrogenase Eha subunit C
MWWLIVLGVLYLLVGAFVAGLAQEDYLPIAMLWALFWPILILAFLFYRVYLLGRDGF